MKPSDATPNTDAPGSRWSTAPTTRSTGSPSRHANAKSRSRSSSTSCTSWATCGTQPTAFTPTTTKPPSAGCTTRRSECSKDTPARSPARSAAKQQPPAWTAPPASPPTKPPTTSPTRAPTSTTPPPSTTAGRSRPGSSKAPAATSSKTAWTSPAPAGDSPAPKRSSSYAPSKPTATSRPTGTTTSLKNDTTSTQPDTSTTPSRASHDHSDRVTRKEPHPSQHPRQPTSRRLRVTPNDEESLKTSPIVSHVDDVKDGRKPVTDKPSRRRSLIDPGS